MTETHSTISLAGARGPERSHAIPILCAVLCAVLAGSLTGADFSNYRGMQFGMDLTAAAKQGGVKATEARLIHQRPALMIEAISAAYGAATRPAVEIAYRSGYGDAGEVLARWDSAYSYNRLRTGDRSSFAMVLYSKRLDALARTAISEAVRLDAHE
ncbi:MAG: hypothetical protein JJE04_26125 [Acidobacteriia bacterium]|nr:hypothetical protein [Terriglobia bacterium]